MSVAVGDVFALWPGWNRISGLIAASSPATVDDGSEKITTVLQIPRTGAIEYVGLGFGNVTTYPTGSIDIRVETVNTTTGNPTGTLFGTNTNWSGSFSSGSNNMILFGPLTSNASVSQGEDLIAIVYAPPANPNAGNVTFKGYGDHQYGFPYSKFYNGVSWAAIAATITCALKYTDGYISHPGMMQVGNVIDVSFNDTDTYDHVGLIATSSVAVEIVGMWAWLDANGNDFVLKLISGSDTVERSVTVEADYTVGTGAELRYGYFSSSFSTQASTAYRYVAYTAASSDISLATHRYSFVNDLSTQNVHQRQNNWFSSIDNCEGELSTPAWQNIAAASNAWPLIGPIVRSIG